MINRILPKRFSLLKTFAFIYLTFAFIVRLCLYFYAFNHIDFSFINLIKILGIGLFFDIGSLAYFLALYAFYLLLIPVKFHGSKLDKIITKFSFGLFVFIITFSFLAEIPFWLEYQRRFNFIAVDYLLYTYEVVENIHQSFPLPLVISFIVLVLILSIKFAKKRDAYKNTFENSDSFKAKIIPFTILLLTVILFHINIKNVQAENFTNVNENELAKSGIYSFFAAYKSNELNFKDFYVTISPNENYSILRNSIKAENDSLLNFGKNIKRYTKNIGIEQKPNVIFIGLESLNARFMERFGSEDNWTPALDSLAKKSIFFTNLYATGTRTIRGMEAISLAIPPTPGRSIVKRENNDNLFTIGEVFKQKGYSRTFIYGGDGHFDNMTNYFSYNGFDIVDRKKSHRLAEKLPTKRNRIEDNEVTFENAWAACDGDVYNKLIKTVDEQYKSKQPFFNFVMTSSNHHPYSFPKGVIKSDEKTRENAVKYADKTFEQFFEKAKNKPWFKNTVFIVMADHCAYSAGRTEINVQNHHIPAYIFNLENETPKEIDKLSSQIDIFPTLFGYLNWNYNSTLFGKDISKMTPNDERAFIGNHRKVGLLKPNKLLILETQKQHTSYLWDKEKNELTTTKTDTIFLKETISYYQSAFELFKNGGLKNTEFNK
ncbi:LTA synthase family protein [Polaribacter ponticola]|uniref:LTA synthase family protein n=1 Tax=Polaribacter ponticola TaxID=2978475 RepID=A0ABT5SC67_9FLAO|nr:LTA synthase family protein [Polaribacter sp. MSW5]MDD7915698.1 LTA synthase family protein [Polaribacter sp. MSW5]